MSIDVLALAPDAQVAASARQLAVPSAWRTYGVDDDFLWGLFGLGDNPYQVRVALDDRATSCSCPSRKVPCKHAIALQLMHAAALIPPDPRPEWVKDWRTGGKQRELDDSPEAAERRAAQRARTAEAREDTVQSGIAALREWLDDLVRAGIAGLPSQGREWCAPAIVRMIDAQAPGLSGMVIDLAWVVASGRPTWTEEAAERIGALHLLIELASHSSRTGSATALEEVVRSRVGFRTRQGEVRESPPWEDDWVVLLQNAIDDEDGQVNTVQQWAWARERREWVIAVAYAVNAPATPLLPLGVELRGTMHPYPAGSPRRVLPGLVDVTGPPSPIPLPSTWAEALAGLEPLLSSDPWQRQFPLGCEGVRLAAAGSAWVLLDTEGHGLRVRDDDGLDRALAVSGGEPFGAICLWDGDVLRLGVATPFGGTPELVG